MVFERTGPALKHVNGSLFATIVGKQPSITYAIVVASMDDIFHPMVGCATKALAQHRAGDLMAGSWLRGNSWCSHMDNR